ncbi:MAG: RNase adapter RapZ [Vicinamibacteria bacterium]
MRARAAAPARPEVLVITGLSGSGKTHVSRALEDIGWFCVDNLPTALIPRFAELLRESEELRCSALVVDIRGRDFVREFPRAFRALARRARASLLFLEAQDQALLRRFSETRRPHPLAVGQPAIEGIREERAALARIRAMADSILDTSTFTVHELRAWVREHYDLRSAPQGLVVTLTSFGYRHGVPLDADLVFDARFLPNPNFVPKLKRLTGAHPAVVRFMRRQPDTEAFLRRIRSLLGFLVPRYVREGKSYLTIGIGCTGGRHRSVMLANALARRLGGRGVSVRVRHRDVRQ